MTKKAKNILWIIGVVLVLAGAVVFLVRDVTPDEVEPETDSAMVETIDSVPTVMNSVVVDTVK